MASPASPSPTTSAVSIKRIHFNDEAPRIGSGWRKVEVSIGRKWVKVRCVATGKLAKFSKIQWSQIDHEQRLSTPKS